MLTNTSVIKEESSVPNKIPDIVILDEHRSKDRSFSTGYIIFFIHLVLMILIKKYRFKLTIPLADEQPKIDFQRARKSFAIACYTLAPSKIYIHYFLE